MNKKYLIFGLMGLFAMAMTSAAILTYYGQEQVYMEIESPVTLTGELSQSVTLLAGDGYNTYLIEGENKLGKDVPVEFTFSLLDSEGKELVDTTGFYLAYSDDIQYAYDEAYGDVDNWVDAKAWMYDNLDWFDWYLTNPVEEYDSSIITNHGDDSAHEVLAFNTAIPQDLSPGEFKAVVYLDVNAGVIPGDYTLSVDMTPTA